MGNDQSPSVYRRHRTPGNKTEYLRVLKILLCCARKDAAGRPVGCTGGRLNHRAAWRTIIRLPPTDRQPAHLHQ